MARLEWHIDQDNLFQTGTDRGVLFPHNDYGVAWSGLTSVSKKQQSVQTTPLYYEGVPFDILDDSENRTMVLSAYTYPDIFDELLGSYRDDRGFVYGEQPRGWFSMAYRTLINQGPDYKINVVMNQKAYNTDESYATVGSSVTPTSFTWEMSGIPIHVMGRTTTFMSFDSRIIRPKTFKEIENTLYGTKTRDSSFKEFLEYMN